MGGADRSLRPRLGPALATRASSARGSAASARMGSCSPSGNTAGPQRRCTASPWTTSSATSATRPVIAATTHRTRRPSAGRTREASGPAASKPRSWATRSCAHAGTASKRSARRRGRRSSGTGSATPARGSTSSTRRTTRSFARNVVTGARTGINVEWWHDGQGSTRNTFTSNRIVSAAKGGLFVDVGDDGNRSSGERLRRRRAAGNRLAGHVRQRGPAEPGLPGRGRRAGSRAIRLLRQRRAGRAETEPVERQYHQQLLSHSLTVRPGKREAAARTWDRFGRVGESLLGEDRRQRRLLRCRADRGPSSRACRPGNGRLHHRHGTRRRPHGRARRRRGDHRALRPATPGGGPFCSRMPWRSSWAAA